MRYRFSEPKQRGYKNKDKFFIVEVEEIGKLGITRKSEIPFEYAKYLIEKVFKNNIAYPDDYWKVKDHEDKGMISAYIEITDLLLQNKTNKEILYHIKEKTKNIKNEV